MDTDTQAKVETIYGLLWTCNLDTTTPAGAAVSMARKLALSMIDKNGQARGIGVAKIAVRNKVMSALPTEPPINPRAG